MLAGDASSTNGGVSEANGGTLPQIDPRSPALSSKTNTGGGMVADARQLSHVSLPAAAAAAAQGASIIKNAAPVDLGSPSVSTITSPPPQVFSSSVASSPIIEHLSGHEPRYFPGVVSRSRRKDSTRQNSIHEGDENTQRKVSSRRDASKERRGE